MTEYDVKHTEVGLVEAEDKEEALEKALQGKSKTGWKSVDTTIRRSDQEPEEPVELTESEADILRRGGTVEVEGCVFTLGENAEDKHGLEADF